MLNALILAFIVTCVAAQPPEECTMEEKATGTLCTVTETVGKIKELFPSHLDLLRRIAYVETRDGNETRCGGIWNVSKENFEKTQQERSIPVTLIDTVNDYLLRMNLSNFESWEKLQWEDLSNPLLSGLAARLWISAHGESIPNSTDVSGQAMFWTQYNVNGESTKFVADVEQLEQFKKGCTIKLDVIFVLDSSFSIGYNNYQNVKEYVAGFVDELDIDQGKHQVGVVIYGDHGETIFNLSTYSEEKNALDAIKNITYNVNNTNTADGLCLMLIGFRQENGARVKDSTVQRWAVVMTDGKSNRNSTRCNGSSTTFEVANKVHSNSPPIKVWAVRVADSVDDAELKAMDNELNAIATEKKYITCLEDFSTSLFNQARDEQMTNLCECATTSAQVGQLSGTLSRGGIVRYELQVPEAGVTVKLCVSVGHILLYGSFIVPNPNSALYDYRKEVISTGRLACGDVFILPIEPTTDRAKRQTNKGASPAGVTSTLYLSLEGVAENNEFFLDISEGDNTVKDDATGGLPEIYILVLMVIGGVILLGFATVVLVILCRKWRNKKKKKTLPPNAANAMSMEVKS